MKIYTVLEPPDGAPDKVAFIKEGFSWAALFLTVLWALWHRMWMIAVLLFAVMSALSVATNFDVIGSGFAALLQFGSALMFALEARSLQVTSLERVGFRRAGLIQASNSEAAELAYFARRAPISSQATSSRFSAVQADTLGIFGNV